MRNKNSNLQFLHPSSLSLCQKVIEAVNNYLIKNERYDLVLTEHKQTKDILDQKNNSSKTKTKCKTGDFQKHVTEFRNQIQLQYKNIGT